MIENSNSGVVLYKADEKYSLVQKNFEENTVGYVNYGSLIDEQILLMCDNIYNTQNNEAHKYNDMMKFLTSSITLADELINISNILNGLVCEGSNYTTNIEFLDKICYAVRNFKNSCENIDYFNESIDNSEKLNGLYELLAEYIDSKNYSENDFNNINLLYSNVQITWTSVKFNLTFYKEQKIDEYDKYQDNNKKAITWTFFKYISNLLFGYSDSQELIVAPKQDKPIIDNVIVWNKKLIKCGNEEQKLIKCDYRKPKLIEYNYKNQQLTKYNPSDQKIFNHIENKKLIPCM